MTLNLGLDPAAIAAFLRTIGQWDKMMEIQAARNEALATHAALTRTTNNEDTQP